MRLLFLWLTAAVCLAADPLIHYSKSFPGSVPPYVGITLQRNGQVEYVEDPNDDNPLKLQLQKPEADEVFGLAEKLEKFKRPLESNLKVANMGLKTFRYESDGERNEVKFNYSLDADGRTIADWFERITETAQHLIQLERTVRFDKLGVNKALLQMQAAMERKRLVALDQFLPLLDRVRKNESYLNMARERAAALADGIRAGAIAATAPAGAGNQNQ